MKIKQFALVISLLGGVLPAYATTPIIMGYYQNSDQYHSYPMSGNAQHASNPDLDAKLTGINTLTYAFFETLTAADASLAGISPGSQAQYVGQVRFSDAWSDLNSDNANDTRFCGEYPYSCGIYTSQYTAWPTSAAGADGNFQAFVNSKVMNHVISIGGAGHDDSWAAAFAYPDNFVNSVVALVNAYGITGLDLDFEPSSAALQQNAEDFVNLVQLLHTDLPHVMLTWPVIPNANFIAALTQSQWQTLAQNLSYVSVMGYDMAGEFSIPTVTGLHSALLAPDSQPEAYNDDSAVKALNAVGISNSQIILGVPSYGRAVGGVTASGLGQNFTLAVQGDLDTPGCSTTPGVSTSCGGTFSYTSLLQSAYTPTEVEVGNQDIGAYTYDGDKQWFVSYDSPSSIAFKANYVIDNNLGGVMMWTLRFDTATNNPDSLLAALDKPFGITPQPPQPGPGPQAGQVIVVNNNQAALQIDDSVSVILQEGNGPLYQQPTVNAGTILANPPANSVLESPGAFGSYNGALSVWIKDVSVSGTQMTQCPIQSVNYNQTGQQITIDVTANGNNVNCASWYSS